MSSYAHKSKPIGGGKKAETLKRKLDTSIMITFQTYLGSMCLTYVTLPQAAITRALPSQLDGGT